MLFVSGTCMAPAQHSMLDAQHNWQQAGRILDMQHLAETAPKHGRQSWRPEVVPIMIHHFAEWRAERRVRHGKRP